jgi:hypothetical protein
MRPVRFNISANYTYKRTTSGEDIFQRLQGSLSDLNLTSTSGLSQNCFVDFTASGEAYFLFSRSTTTLLPSPQLSEVDFNPIPGNTGITIVKINP